MANLLEKASILITPTAYSDGKIHSAKPIQSLSAEKVVNGDFATDSDWVKEVGITISGGKANFSGNNNASLRQNGIIIVGKTYLVKFEITDYTSGNLDVNIGGSTRQGQFSGEGFYEVSNICIGQGNLFFQENQSNGGFVGSITNVSVKEVIDSDLNFTRGSGATRTNAQGLIENVDTLGSEAVVNGDFATDSSWAKGGGATISDGKANIIGDGSGFTSVSQNGVFTSGKQYQVKVDVVINSGLGLKFQDGANNENIGFATTSGTYTFNFTATVNSTIAIGRRTGGTPFNSSIDNISVKEIIDVTNIPRINYKDGVGSWLIEPQSTNLYLNSALIVTQNITTLASSYTVSFYGTGTITFTGTYSGSLTGTGVNDRVRITFTTTSGTLTSTVSGTVTQGQSEEGNITSYIPTNGSVQTRLEETASRSGLGDLIDSTQGVLYAEMSALANVNIQRTLSISDGTHSNSVKLGFSKDVTDYKIFANVRLGGVSQVFLTFNLGNVEPTFKKCAIKYKQNDFSLWVNGIEVATSTIGSTFTLNTLNYFAFNRGNGGQIFEGDIKSLAIFPILTDEELGCLTTE